MRDEIQELKDRSTAAATARPVNSADPHPPLQAACNIDNDLARRLSLIEGQQQQLMLHNIQAQLPTPPQGARNKIKSDRSQRSRRNKPQDGSRPQYKLKLCGLHVSPNSFQPRMSPSKGLGPALFTGRIITPVNATGRAIIFTSPI